MRQTVITVAKIPKLFRYLDVLRCVGAFILAVDAHGRDQQSLERSSVH
jgi:hypothetical protein